MAETALRRSQIKTIVRCYNDMVVVFDKSDEQIPRYQGTYAEVRQTILADAPPDAIFMRFPRDCGELQTVDRASW